MRAGELSGVGMAATRSTSRFPLHLAVFAAVVLFPPVVTVTVRPRKDGRRRVTVRRGHIRRWVARRRIRGWVRWARIGRGVGHMIARRGGRVSGIGSRVLRRAVAWVSRHGRGGCRRRGRRGGPRGPWGPNRGPPLRRPSAAQRACEAAWSRPILARDGVGGLFPPTRIKRRRIVSTRVRHLHDKPRDNVVPGGALRTE